MDKVKKTLKDFLSPRHLHWEFAAYVSREGYKMLEMSKVTVLGLQTEEEALQSVKEILSRPFYHLVQVWECSTCITVEQQQKTLKAQEDFIKKALKEHDE